MSNEGSVAERSQVRAERQEPAWERDAVRSLSASAVTSLKCADVFLTVHYFSTHTLSRFILIFHVLLETLLIEFCCQLIPSLFVKKWSNLSPSSSRGGRQSGQQHHDGRRRHAAPHGREWWRSLTTPFGSAPTLAWASPSPVLIGQRRTVPRQWQTFSLAPPLSPSSCWLKRTAGALKPRPLTLPSCHVITAVLFCFVFNIFLLFCFSSWWK